MMDRLGSEVSPGDLLLSSRGLLYEAQATDVSVQVRGFVIRALILNNRLRPRSPSDPVYVANRDVVKINAREAGLVAQGSPAARIGTWKVKVGR